MLRRGSVLWRETGRWTGEDWDVQGQEDVGKGDLRGLAWERQAAKHRHWLHAPGLHLHQWVALSPSLKPHVVQFPHLYKGNNNIISKDLQGVTWKFSEQDMAHRRCWINASHVQGDGDAIRQDRGHERMHKFWGRRMISSGLDTSTWSACGTRRRQLRVRGCSSEESSESQRLLHQGWCGVRVTSEQGPGRQQGASPERTE